MSIKKTGIYKEFIRNVSLKLRSQKEIYPKKKAKRKI